MADQLRHHFTWSIESPRGKCPVCGDTTVVVMSGGLWFPAADAAIEQVGLERYEAEFSEPVSVFDEVVGNFCGTCQRLTSLSFNSSPSNPSE